MSDDCAIHGGTEDTAADTERALRRKIERQRVEIEELKHDLERHMTIANDTANENEELRAAVCALWAGAPSHDLDPDMTLFVGGVVADSQAFQTGGNRNE